MKNIIRLSLYLLGFFILAIGVNIAILSDLGVSPVTSLPLAISNITGKSLGTITTIVFAFYVLMQVLILRKDFKAKDLLQMLFGFVFGFFVDLTSVLVSWVGVTNYLGQILLLLLSTLVIGIGLMFIITMDIVPAASEGIILAVCKVKNLPFPKMKIYFDCTSVFLAATLSLTFLGNVSAIREGTVISALVIGKILGVLMKKYKPILHAVAFHTELEVPQVSSQASQ